MSDKENELLKKFMKYIMGEVGAYTDEDLTVDDAMGRLWEINRDIEKGEFVLDEHMEGL